MTASPEVLRRIPHRPPFLFVDAILAETPEGLVAQKTWRAEEDFYAGHYPGAPITPGVLLCEAVFQAGALYLAKAIGAAAAPGGVPLLARIADVRFRNPVYPGDTVQIEVKQQDVVAGFYQLAGAIRRGDTRILTVAFAVAWRVPGGSPP